MPPPSDSAKDGGATGDGLRLIEQSRILVKKALDVRQRTHQTIMEAREAIEHARVLQEELARPKAPRR